LFQRPEKTKNSAGPHPGQAKRTRTAAPTKKKVEDSEDHAAVESQASVQRPKNGAGPHTGPAKRTRTAAPKKKKKVEDQEADPKDPRADELPRP
jgi:hypothetical protein